VFRRLPVRAVVRTQTGHRGMTAASGIPPPLGQRLGANLSWARQDLRSVVGNRTASGESASNATWRARPPVPVRWPSPAATAQCYGTVRLLRVFRRRGMDSAVSVWRFAVGRAPSRPTAPAPAPTRSRPRAARLRQRPPAAAQIQPPSGRRSGRRLGSGRTATTAPLGGASSDGMPRKGRGRLGASVAQGSGRTYVQRMELQSIGFCQCYGPASSRRAFFGDAVSPNCFIFL